MKGIKTKIKLFLALAALIVVGIYYYVALPAINIHSTDFWLFLIVALVILLVISVGRKMMHLQTREDFRDLRYEIRGRKSPKVILAVLAAVIVVLQWALFCHLPL